MFDYPYNTYSQTIRPMVRSLRIPTLASGGAHIAHNDPDRPAHRRPAPGDPHFRGGCRRLARQRRRRALTPAISSPRPLGVPRGPTAGRSRTVSRCDAFDDDSALRPPGPETTDLPAAWRPRPPFHSPRRLTEGSYATPEDRGGARQAPRADPRSCAEGKSGATRRSSTGFRQGGWRSRDRRVVDQRSLAVELRPD